MGHVVSEKIGNPAHRAGPQHLNLYQQAIQRILWIFEFWVLRCNCNFLAIHIIWFNFSHDWWQLGENFQFSCHLFQLLKSETVCGPMGFPPFASSNGTENYLTVTMILVSLFRAAIYLACWRDESSQDLSLFQHFRWSKIRICRSDLPSIDWKSRVSSPHEWRKVRA